MSAKFHQNILQPKRQNAVLQPLRNEKEIAPKPIVPSGATLTLNGVTVALPSEVPQLPGTTNAKRKPRSTTMAKRNARERNRVKLVNQGFQTLKQHIPDGFRVKKMSKVDTLRCALEYIRCMEQVLESNPMEGEGMDAEAGAHGNSGYSVLSQEEINQHLDRICSLEDSSNLSLDHSFSSFSGSDTLSPTRNAGGIPETVIGTEIPMPNVDNSSGRVMTASGEVTSPAVGIMTENTSVVDTQFQHIMIPNVSGQSEGQESVVLPVQFAGLDENGMQIITTDENFLPGNQHFIQVVEIIQM